MTGAWFDVVAKAMVGARPRRAVLSALIGAATIGRLRRGASVSAGEDGLAEACRGKGAKCRQGGQCCSGRCKKHHGKNKKKGKCRCSRYLTPCSKDSDCCAFEVPLVCVKVNAGAPGTCET
jgi:hypothetical protein